MVNTIEKFICFPGFFNKSISTQVKRSYTHLYGKTLTGMCTQSIVVFYDVIVKDYKIEVTGLPGHCLQHSPATVNCSEGGQDSAGQWSSGSSGRQFIDPLRHWHSRQWRGLTRSPWSYVDPRK